MDPHHPHTLATDADWSSLRASSTVLQSGVVALAAPDETEGAGLSAGHAGHQHESQDKTLIGAQKLQHSRRRLRMAVSTYSVCPQHRNRVGTKGAAERHDPPLDELAPVVPSAPQVRASALMLAPHVPQVVWQKPLAAMKQ